jgi:hypothetical protein
MENKAIIVSTLTALAVGAAAGFFLSPTKIETKEVIKDVVKQVVVDRFITKVTKPDGTITEVITEKDRTLTKEHDSETSKSETNPKRVSVGVVAKTNATALQMIQPGVQISADTGLWNTFVTGSVFKDGEIVLGFGIKL